MPHTQRYKAVFTDIDGTILNSQHQLTPKTIHSIQHLLAQQIPFILSSARPPLAIQPFNQQLHSTNPMICYGGALLVDANLTPLYSKPLEQIDVDKLSNLLEQVPDLSVNYYSGVEWFCPNPENPWTVREGEITQLQAKQKPKKVENVHKVLVMAEAKLILVTEKVLKKLFPQLSIYRSKDEYLEIMHKAATKSNAIQFFEKQFGITQEEVVAFGDNFNDLDMLTYAGLGVAMGNAPEQIKQAVDKVAPDNDHDGFAVVLDELFA